MSSPSKRVFILLGPPGVGKGTQAQQIAKAYQLLHIDTGHSLRTEIAMATELGLTAKAYVDKGELVPFELVIQVIKASMLRIEPSQQGYLFDGFPRNLDQAGGMDQILGDLSLELNRVVYLETPHDILMDRLAYRITCGDCDAKFNLKLNPPKVEGTCDRCGSTNLVTRKDDQPDVIENRLIAYQNETAPLVAHYEGLSKLTRVDANQSIDVVFNAIGGVLNPFFPATIS